MLSDGRILDVDIVLRRERIVVEYDGEYWHRLSLHQDIAKREWLETAAWRVIRVRQGALLSTAPDDVHVPTGAGAAFTAARVLERLAAMTGMRHSDLDGYIQAGAPTRHEEAERYIRSRLVEREIATQRPASTQSAAGRIPAILGFSPAPEGSPRQHEWPNLP